MLVILEQIGRFTEEMELIGLDNDVLGDSIEKFNRALEWAKAEDPENPVWGMLESLDPGSTSPAKLTLSCRMLADIIRERTKRSADTPTWTVTEDTELRGSYEGTVEIMPGSTFKLKGSVEGKVIIHENATFVCSGYLQGDIEKSSLGVLEARGRIEGNVYTIESQSPDAE